MGKVSRSHGHFETASWTACLRASAGMSGGANAPRRLFVPAFPEPRITVRREPDTRTGILPP